jgi:hypothetical protein
MMSKVSSYATQDDVLASAEVERNLESYAANAAQLKSTFHEVEMLPVKPASGHTHAGSAAARSTASRFIDQLALACGKRAVFYQGSASDLRNGRVVTRTYHWAKDVYVPVQNQEAKANDIVAMVDVDYYVDMPKFLTTHDKPVILYTFTPAASAADRGEYKYTFRQDGSVDYMVSGGGNFQHQLWDWSGDTVSITTTWFFGWFKWSYVTYAVERREIDQDHSLILLMPLGRLKGDLLSHTDNLQAKELVRLNPVTSGFARVRVNTPAGLFQSTARCGQFSSSLTTAKVDEAIINLVIARKQKLTLGVVKSVMGSSKEDQSGCEVLFAYHSLAIPHAGALVDVTPGLRSFQWMSRDGTFDDDAKVRMKSFMDPIVDGGFVPDDSRGNDERSVQKRIEELKKPTVKKMSYFLSQTMDEFLERVIPEPGVCIPVDEDTVRERQNRPTQQAIIDQAEFQELGLPATGMVKNEAYGKVTDPRMITIMAGRDKVDYSKYTYAFHDVLVDKPWYAFSKKPAEVAQRVSEIAELATRHADMKDYHRLDGTIGPPSRELNRRGYVRAFKPEYHLELHSAMRRNFNKTVRTRHGVTYESKWAQCSGDVATSDSNTMTNAFTAYHGFRLMGLEPDEAYEALGIYGGDDGMDCDADRKCMEIAASKMGLILELERVPRGDLGVHFLARCYGPDVWFGEADSTCDIKRQASKFHLSIPLPSKVTPAQKLVDKCFAFYLSDVNTPIIGDLCKKVRDLFPELWPQTANWKNLNQLWRPHLEDSVQYPNRVEDWASDLVDRQLPNFDLESFLDKLQTATRETIFTMGTCDPERPEVLVDEGIVMVEGDIHGTPEELPPPVAVQVVVTEDPARPILRVAPPTAEERKGAKKEHKRFRPRKPRARSANRGRNKAKCS